MNKIKIITKKVRTVSMWFGLFLAVFVSGLVYKAQSFNGNNSTVSKLESEIAQLNESIERRSVEIRKLRDKLTRNHSPAGGVLTSEHLKELISEELVGIEKMRVTVKKPIRKESHYYHELETEVQLTGISPHEFYSLLHGLEKSPALGFRKHANTRIVKLKASVSEPFLDIELTVRQFFCKQVIEKN